MLCFLCRGHGCAGDTDRDDSANSLSIMMGAGGPGWPAPHNTLLITIQITSICLLLWVAHTGLTLCMYVLSSLLSSSRLFHLDRYSLWNSIFPSVACLLVSGSRDSLGHNKFPFVFCKSFQFWPDCGDYHRTNSMKYARICIAPEADVLLFNTHFTERWTSFHAILTCFKTL